MIFNLEKYFLESTIRSTNLIDKLNQTGNKNRTVLESVVVPEVSMALNDWVKVVPNTGVLIGGLALSYHVKPRSTMDVDLMFISDSAVPISVEGFKKTRNHAFMHLKTHVEIEVLTPEFLKMPTEVIQKIIDTSTNSKGLLVASKEGLIVSKLYRFNRQDQADIEKLKELGEVSIEEFPVSDLEIERFESI
jgi:hypothetical protein